MLKLQGDMVEADTRFKLYDGAISGRIQGVESNIQSIPRGKFSDYYIDKTTDEWKFEQCRLKEKEVDHQYCGQCDQRFHCWTAGRPQPVNVFGDTHIGLQKIQSCMKAQMITIDEASEGFKRLSQQLCDAMTKKFDNDILKGIR